MKLIASALVFTVALTSMGGAYADSNEEHSYEEESLSPCGVDLECTEPGEVCHLRKNGMFCVSQERFPCLDDPDCPLSLNCFTNNDAAEWGMCNGCAADADCEANENTPVCALPGFGFGQCVECVTLENCDEGSYCDHNQCVPQFADGANCKDNDQCLSGDCSETPGRRLLGSRGSRHRRPKKVCQVAPL